MQEADVSIPHERVRVDPGDVIIIRDDDVISASEKDFGVYLAEIHDHFPTSLVVVMGSNDSFQTEPIDVLRSMLEDLIAHKEAIEKEAATQ